MNQRQDKTSPMPVASSYVDRALSVQRTIMDEFRPDGRLPIRQNAIEHAPPVVFVPTFAELGFVYEPLYTELGRTHRTVSYAPNVSAYQQFGPEERASELRAVLDDLDITDPVHLVSWSDAGTGAVEFCRRWPDSVRSCVFLGMPWQYRLPIGLSQLARLYLRTPLFRATPNVLAGVLIAALMGGKKIPSRSLYGQLRALGPVSRYLRYSILPCLDYTVHELSKPPKTLVMGGDGDRFVTEESMRHLANMMGAEFVPVPSGDHFLPWTSPDMVTPRVAEFIREVDRETGT